MSTVAAAAYRFLTPQQWSRCLLHRMDLDDGLVAIRRLSSRAGVIGPHGPVSNVGLTPGGTPYGRLDRPTAGGSAVFHMVDDDREAGPFEVEGSLASSARWVIDRDAIWAFAPDSVSVERYERDTLERDRSIEAGAPILDATTDGRKGVWLLVGRGDAAFELLHIDCRGCVRERHPVPCEAGAPTQLGSVEQGRRLVLLTAGGKRLVFVNPATGQAERTLSIGNLAACWSALRMATDGRSRIALSGDAGVENMPPQGISFVLDAAGDIIDGPLEDATIFAARGGANPAPTVAAIAVRRDALWFATSQGLWRLGAAEGSGALESDSTLLTPGLLSPDSNPVRGWLRAEVFADVPRGGVLEAEFASTDDPHIAAQAAVLADDRSSTTSQRQDAIWQLFEHPPRRQFRFTSAPASGEPIAVPVFESRDRWLWLRLKLMAPPGTSSGKITQLRVYYPERSIAQHLPAAFLGERKDPTGTMRRLVGVLESTTQRIDERIRSIGSHIDPDTAPDGWLDYLGRWLDLPWDDQLPDPAKRRVLQDAGALLDQRGTRSGIKRLLQALLGVDAAVRIEDLTVDHSVAVLGGNGQAGPALPALLAGVPLRTPTLGIKAVIGRACLARPDDLALTDPFDTIVPTLRIGISASREIRQELEPLLKAILAQYVPAGVRVQIRWDGPSRISDLSDTNPLVLDAEGPARLGRDSTLGRTVLEGRRGRLDDAGLGVGLTVQ